MRLRTSGTFIFILLFGCGQKGDGDTQKKNEGWKTLSESNYYIEYPPNWYLDKNKNLGTSFILFARDESEKRFRENVNLVIQDLRGQNLNLDRYVQLSERQVTTMVRNSKLIESKRMKAADDEYHQIVYLGDHEEFHLKWKQFYWVKGDKAFVLTFTGTQDTYEAFIKVADNILKSFKITGD